VKVAFQLACLGVAKLVISPKSSLEHRLGLLTLVVQVLYQEWLQLLALRELPLQAP